MGIIMTTPSYQVRPQSTFLYQSLYLFHCLKKLQSHTTSVNKDINFFLSQAIIHVIVWFHS